MIELKLSSSMEDYLEAIFAICQEREYARCIDFSDYLGVTMPSVSRAVKELEKKGHLVRECGALSLTPSGLQIAKDIYERHLFFAERLIAAGVDPETAEADACRMEHGISEESFEKLKAQLKGKA